MKHAVIAWLKIQVQSHAMQRATAQEVLSELHYSDSTGDSWPDNLPDTLEAFGHPELAERAVSDGLGYAGPDMTPDQIAAALQAAAE